MGAIRRWNDALGEDTTEAWSEPQQGAINGEASDTALEPAQSQEQSEPKDCEEDSHDKVVEPPAQG